MRPYTNQQLTSLTVELGDTIWEMMERGSKGEF